MPHALYKRNIQYSCAKVLALQFMLNFSRGLSNDWLYNSWH